jgi:hypothetical protein
MEIGSHYYAVLALCRLLGLKKEASYRIAYSSQYVDDALIKRIIFKKRAKGVKYHIFGERKGLDFCATCPKISSIWTYHHVRMINTLVPFHFVPGCKGSRFSRQIRTSPNSPILSELIESTVNTGNIYSLGIVLHVIGDAYAHRGFSGIVSRGNRVRKLRVNMDTIRGSSDRFLAKFIAETPRLHSKTMAKILPMYSHSRVGTVPDLSSAEWSYEYDAGIGRQLPKFRSSGNISNPERYREAFNRMIDIIEKFVKLHPEILENPRTDLQEAAFFEQLTAVVSRDDTQASWEKYMLALKLFDKEDIALIYDKHAWLSKAFDSYKKNMHSRYFITGALPADDFVHSDWYQFYLAQREYKEHYDRLVVKYEIF